MKSSTLFCSALALTAALAVGCADAGPTGLEDPAASRGAPDATGVSEASGESVVCGLDVEFTVFNAGAAWDAPFGPPERAARTNVFTLTNPANGKSVSVRTAGQVTREVVAFHQDGSFTVREEIEGALSKIQTSEGELLTIGSGRLILQFRVIPGPDGFVLADLQVIFEAGTTEQAPPLFTPEWCEIVVGALT